MIVENVDCYSSGIICRKFISINVGNSLLIFDDDSGSPVRPGSGSGCTESLYVNRGWRGRGKRAEDPVPWRRARFLGAIESAAQIELLGQSQEHRSQCQDVRGV